MAPPTALPTVTPTLCLDAWAVGDEDDEANGVFDIAGEVSDETEEALGEVKCWGQ